MMDCPFDFKSTVSVRVTGVISGNNHPSRESLLPPTKHIGGAELIIAACHSILLWGLDGLAGQTVFGNAGWAPRLRYR
jgi:hypothetical protein